MQTPTLDQCANATTSRTGKSLRRAVACAAGAGIGGAVVISACAAHAIAAENAAANRKVAAMQNGFRIFIGD